MKILKDYEIGSVRPEFDFICFTTWCSFGSNPNNRPRF